MNKKKKEPDRHEVKNFKDLCNLLTSENCDNLCKDVASWMKAYINMIDSIREGLPEITKNLTNWEIMEGSFTWIDDGKNDCKGITIKFKPSGNTEEE